MSVALIFIGLVTTLITLFALMGHKNQQFYFSKLLFYESLVLFVAVFGCYFSPNIGLQMNECAREGVIVCIRITFTLLLFLTSLVTVIFFFASWLFQPKVIIKSSWAVLLILPWAVFWLYLYARIPDSDNIACIVALSGSTYDSYRNRLLNAISYGNRNRLLNAISQLEDGYDDIFLHAFNMGREVSWLTPPESLGILKSVCYASLADVINMEKATTDFIAALIREKNVPQEKANEFSGLVLHYRTFFEGCRRVLNNPHTTYESFVSFLKTAIAEGEGDEGILCKWITAVEEEFQIKFVKSAVGGVGRGRTFSECKVNFLSIVDVYARGAFLVDDRDVQEMLCDLVDTRQKTSYIRFVEDLYTHELTKFNKIRPALVDPLIRLLEEKNVSPENNSAKKIFELLESYSRRLQMIYFPKSRPDYNHLHLQSLKYDAYYLEKAEFYFGSLFDKLSEDVDKENIPARRIQAAQAQADAGAYSYRKTGKGLRRQRKQAAKMRAKKLEGQLRELEKAKR